MRILNSRGFSLVMVIVFIALLSSLAIIAVKMGGLTAISIRGELKGKQSYYLAESAYQHAIFKLSQNTNWRGDLIDQPMSGGLYSLNVSQISPIDDITITAVGSIDGTERTIVRVIPPPIKLFIIVPFAGTGKSGDKGDNQSALGAELNKPRGLARNAAGDVYIADTDNHRIRYVDALKQKIYKFSGKAGKDGYNCNDCEPDKAWHKKPEGVFINTAGNVYIADTENHIVRKVPPGGNIITIAGIPESGGYSGDNGLATSAKLDKPRDVAVDATGNVYIADADNCRIRKVNSVTSIITTFAGTGSCGFNGDGNLAANTKLDKPRGLALDSAGNLYIADTDNNRIRKINMATMLVSTIAGTSGGFAGDNGPAVNAKINKPRGIAINQFGTIYIADTDNHRIRRIDPLTGNISTHAGTGNGGDSGDGGLAIDARLDKPGSVIAYDDVDGHILIADTDNHRVREVTNVY